MEDQRRLGSSDAQFLETLLEDESKALLDRQDGQLKGFRAQHFGDSDRFRVNRDRDSHCSG